MSTYPDVTPETVREHLRDVHGDEDWSTDHDPMGLHRMIHQDAVPPDSGQMGWQQGHLHPEYPLFLGEGVDTALSLVPKGWLARNACPLCGSRRHEDGEASPVEFVVCAGCREMLTVDELVRVHTAWTARRYNEANGHPADYR